MRVGMEQLLFAVSISLISSDTFPAVTSLAPVISGNDGGVLENDCAENGCDRLGSDVAVGTGVFVGAIPLLLSLNSSARGTVDDVNVIGPNQPSMSFCTKPTCSPQGWM